MYTLIRNAWQRKELVSVTLAELIALTVSFLIAETFYKFRSFTLECAAFLATWLVIGFVFSLVGNAFRRRTERANQTD